MSPCSGGRLASAPRWKQWPCTAGSTGGTTPLFTPSEGGGGGGVDEPRPCLQVGEVSSGPAPPADSGQEWLCAGGGGLGEQVEQVEAVGAPWRRTGE